MKQDEIIEMARQAGFEDFVRWSERYPHEVQRWIERMTAFTKLVAAKEREACAKVCEDLPAPDIYSNTDMSMWDVTCIDCAESIRARGQA
jgi:hypothetical protein